MAQRKADSQSDDRLERWFAQIWNSTEKYPVGLSDWGPSNRTVWQFLGWGEKKNAVNRYAGRESKDGTWIDGTVPQGQYILRTVAGQVFHSLAQLREVMPRGGTAYEMLLTQSGFDHCLLTAPAEHGQRNRQLFIDCKDKVWKAREDKLYFGARCTRADAQVLATEMAVICGRSPIGECVQGARSQWGETPMDLRVLAEAATGIPVERHSDALTVEALGLEIIRLGRQVSYREPAQIAAMAVVEDAKAQGWPTETRFHKTKGYEYEVLEPKFDPRRALNLRKTRKLNELSVVDLAVGKPKPNVQQRSLF
jgi:hypothetical protein